eukprot:PITA_23439
MALVGECIETDPSSFEEAVQQLIWVDAMVDEYDSIFRNSVWDVVPRPENKSVVSSRWLYKVDGIDYDETFAPVERYSSLRSMLALSTQMGWNIHQMDVQIAFLNGKIEEEVYIEKLEGDDQLIMSCKEYLEREFEMKDMGLMHYFLGMEVWQKDGELLMSQGKYANEILRRIHMEKFKPMQTPLADLCYAVNQLSQAMVQPTKMFWKAAKHVLRYLRGTSQYGLWYRRTEGVKLQGSTDADWVGSPSDRKSTSGGIFNLGSTAISWYNRKKRSVALRSTEVEYMAASQATCETIWMQKILVALFDQRMDPTLIYCDNQSYIKFAENPVFHERSKHIDIRYHHLRDCVARRIMLFQYISTEEKDVDILTKALSKCKFEFHRDRIGVADNPFLVEREC